MADTPQTFTDDVSRAEMLNNQQVLSTYAMLNPLVAGSSNPFSMLSAQNTDLYALLYGSSPVQYAGAGQISVSDYLAKLIPLVSELMANSPSIIPNYSKECEIDSQEEQKTYSVRVTGGGKTPIFENNTFCLSDDALTRIWNMPGESRQIIQEEMYTAFQTKDPAKIVERMTRIEIKTGFGQERKTLFAWQLLQNITDDMHKQIKDAWQLPQETISAPLQSEIQRGGIVLGREWVDAIKARPDDAEDIVGKALEQVTGTTDKAKMMANIVGVDQLEGNDKEQYAQELYDYTVKDLAERYKKYVAA